MRGLLFWACAFSFLAMGPTCQQPDRAGEGRTRLIVSDVPCETVWDRLLQELKRLNLPVSRLDREKGVIETAPVAGEPLPGDAYQQVEERFLLVITCRDTLTTRVTGKALVKGLGPDKSWVPIEDADRYWERFLGKVRMQ